MLKIPEDGKLIDAGQLYRYADSEYQKRRKCSDDPELIKFAETLRDVIGEMAYDLPAKGEDAVVHGEWLYYSTTMMRCSKCYRTVPVHRYGYCPHCGATMTRKWTL